MNCRDMDAAIFRDPLSPEARQHLETCPDCRALATTVEQTKQRILEDLTPVRPLASAGTYAILLVGIAAGVAWGMAAAKGLLGPHALSLAQAIGIFGALAGLLPLAAFTVSREMRPGARTLPAPVLFVLATGLTESVFLALFHDYRPGQFLHWGLGCFAMGMLCAAATAMLAWIPVRRGYLVAPASAGAAIGGLSGLAGLATLELHCPILNVPHLAVWHAGVVLASIAIGYLGGKLGSGTK